jgi:hypothetical protein
METVKQTPAILASEGKIEKRRRQGQPYLDRENFDQY